MHGSLSVPFLLCLSSAFCQTIQITDSMDPEVPIAARRYSAHPAISGDGNLIAFNSTADLAGDGQNISHIDVWLYNVAETALTRVTGSGANMLSPNSKRPDISADGHFVAFLSNEDFLDEGRDRDDIWLYEVATTGLSRLTDYTLAENERASISGISMSGDGKRIAFVSDGDFKSEGREALFDEVWLYNVDKTSYTRLTDVRANGLTDRDAFQPRISRNGEYVVFSSDADFLQDGRRNEDDEIWLYEVETATLTPITDIRSGAGVFRESNCPSISGDGMRIAFQSDADLLQEGRPDGDVEIWLYDRMEDEFHRITDARANGATNRDSEQPRMSADGRFIAFESDADLLSEDRPDSVTEIWLYDIQEDMLTRLTDSLSNVESTFRDCRNPAIGITGSFICFDGDADLVGTGVVDGEFETFLFQQILAAPGYSGFVID